MALSVGEQLGIYDLGAESITGPRVEVPCSLSPELAWCPAGDRLAFRDEAGQGRVIVVPGPGGAPGGEYLVTPGGQAGCMAFVPGSDRLILLVPSLPGRITLRMVSADRTVLWEETLTRDQARIRQDGASLAVSPDGSMVACAGGTSAIWVLEVATGRTVMKFEGHSQAVTGLSWLDNDRVLSASPDATLRAWRPDGAKAPTVVETIAAAGMAYASDRQTALVWSAKGEMIAWCMKGAPAQLWHRDPPTRSVAAHFTRLTASAAGDRLALMDAGSTELMMVSGWDQALGGPDATTTYANAKILVLGDSGVGKSGLAMVLAGKKFTPTESTHGRRIFAIPQVQERDATGERDVLLWDLAGQPGYRIVHQLHLEGAALALILFDAKSETRPMSGVRHWARALRHAYPEETGGLTTFLVAARDDRGGINVSTERINQLMRTFGIADYFTTSAREGNNVNLLRSRILREIDWERLPEVKSTELFAAVKDFILGQKETGAVLLPLDTLRRDFRKHDPRGRRLLAGRGREEEPCQGARKVSVDELNSAFDSCVERLESVGLVKRLKFGDYVLLEPHLLDSYAGAIVNAARAEPQGLGSILESKVVNLQIDIPSSGRVKERKLERLLVYATLEELLQHELALRELADEPDDHDAQLVFPSAYRLDLPDSEKPKGDGVLFRFEGPVESIYATLIVRLARTNVFKRVGAWHEAAQFTDDAGKCTIALNYDGEGSGELRLSYDQLADDPRRQLERFVHNHLSRGALPGSVVRERQYSCPVDGLAFTEEQVSQVRNLGKSAILCPACEGRVSLSDDYELANGSDGTTAAMDASADAGRDLAANAAVVGGKQEAAEFDVFLCHNSEDKPAVRDLARRLKERGLRPWLDENELRPGVPGQPELERAIRRIPAAAVIVGSRMGPWQDREVDAFLQQFVDRGCPVVPVLLPGARRVDLPIFLGSMTWVELGKPEPDPINRLVWGITGQRPED